MFRTPVLDSYEVLTCEIHPIGLILGEIYICYFHWFVLILLRFFQWGANTRKLPNSPKSHLRVFNGSELIIPTKIQPLGDISHIKTLYESRRGGGGGESGTFLSIRDSSGGVSGIKEYFLCRSFVLVTFLYNVLG